MSGKDILDIFLTQVNTIAKIYKEMPIQQVILFLLVAQNEGITQLEITKLSGQTQASVSRNLSKLGKHLKDDPESATGKSYFGHGLIISEPDAANRKTLALFLSPKGIALTRDIQVACGQ